MSSFVSFCNDDRQRPRAASLAGHMTIIPMGQKADSYPTVRSRGLKPRQSLFFSFR